MDTGDLPILTSWTSWQFTPVERAGNKGGVWELVSTTLRDFEETKINLHARSIIPA